MAGKQQRLKAKAEEETEDTEAMDEEEEEETSAMDDTEEEEEATDDEEEKPSAKKASAKPASYKQLKAELIGADAEFITSQLDQEATVAQATKAWMKEQNTRVQKANRPGNAPVSHNRANNGGGTVDTSAQAALEAAIKLEMKESGLPKTEAAKRLRAKNKALFDAVLLDK